MSSLLAVVYMEKLTLHWVNRNIGVPQEPSKPKRSQVAHRTALCSHLLNGYKYGFQKTINSSVLSHISKTPQGSVGLEIWVKVRMKRVSLLTFLMIMAIATARKESQSTRVWVSLLTRWFWSAADFLIIRMAIVKARGRSEAMFCFDAFNIQ